MVGKVTQIKLVLLFIPALLLELHQRIRGYAFNPCQLMDLSLHHEHLILFFCLAAIFYTLREATNEQIRKELEEASE
jgi:hypothetical protein